jgi:UDP-2,3-diacylglucosamine hydrolase
LSSRSGARLIDDPIIIDLYGEPALLTHGDALCVADRPYQLLRGVVRSARWQRPLPASAAGAAPRPGRAGAPGQPAPYAAHRQPDHGRDQAAVSATMRACGVRTLIHGHTHRPAVHEFELDGRPRAASCSAPGTSQGSVLAWGPDGFRLEELPRSTAQQCA